MTAAELRAKSADEIRTELEGLHRELLSLRFQLHGGQLQNTATVRQVRRSIARAMTILNEKMRQSPAEAGSSAAAGQA